MSAGRHRPRRGRPVLRDLLLGLVVVVVAAAVAAVVLGLLFPSRPLATIGSLQPVVITERSAR
ncbi:MAG: hypothetical protein JNM77_08725 [Pseudonocardia sp.]|nr:hypothetical protein [Pseudonocardia sp.]